MLVEAAAGAAALAYLDAKLLLSSDLRILGAFAGIAARIPRLEKQGKLTTYYTLKEHAEKRPNAPAIIFESYTWTWLAFFKAVNRCAHWLTKDLGLKRGDTVALDFTNCVEYCMLCLAVEATGIASAHINCNLTDDSLVHCVKIVSPKLLIIDPDVSHLVDPVAETLKSEGVEILKFRYDAIPPDDTDLSPEIHKDMLSDDVVGTTGLPKATTIPRGRGLESAIWFANYARLKHKDVYYTCMPMYHAAAQALAFRPSIFAGNTFVLGRKFSHKTFWPEIVASKATHLQYVGELLRYIVNAPPGPLDRAHNLRLAFGNGCRPDVWPKFQERFGVKTILEFYAATDGVASTFNLNHGGEFGRGAIGTFGFLYGQTLGRLSMLVRVDAEGELVRDPKTGFCIKCKNDEPGEFITKWVGLTESRFKGYHGNPKAGQKRLVSDVFEKGDRYFRSGDILRKTADGQWFFVDRVGDTFRWKSENVSTNEVADVLGHFPSLGEANVYGIELPHHDGRCGCAALVIPDPSSFDFRGLAKHSLAKLPSYAVPLFIRTLNEMPFTGTWKMQKVKLRQDGADPTKLEAGESLYWLRGGEYVPFTRKDWDELIGGSVRL